MSNPDDFRPDVIGDVRNEPEQPALTLPARVLTLPNQIGYWFTDALGHFHVGVEAHAGEPGWEVCFLGGPGCDPLTIRDADAGVVCWYALDHAATTTGMSFAGALRHAREAWRELSANAEDLARGAADPYDPEPFVEPWWARPEGGAHE